MNEEALKKIKSRQKSIVDLIYYFLNSKLFTRFNVFYSYDNEKLLGCSGIMLNIADVSFVLLQQEWMEKKKPESHFSLFYFYFYLFPSRSSCIFRYVTMCNNGISNTVFFFVLLKKNKVSSHCNLFCSLYSKESSFHWMYDEKE